MRAYLRVNSDTFFFDDEDQLDLIRQKIVTAVRAGGDFIQASLSKDVLITPATHVRIDYLPEIDDWDEEQSTDSGFVDFDKFSP